MYLRCVLNILVFYVVYLSAIDPCPKSLTIDISKGTKNGNRYVFNNMTFRSSSYFVDNGTVLGCICHVRKCIRRCCSDDESKNPTHLMCKQDDLLPLFSYNNKKQLNLSPQVIDSLDFFVVSEHPCVEDNLLVPHESDEYFIKEDGVLYSLLANDTYSIHRYCLMNKQGYVCMNTSEPQVAITDEPEPSEITLMRNIHIIGMIISMPFLVTTFFVYLILPERNLHRRALMSYVFTLLAAYITLVTIQLYSGQFPDVPCHILGYLIIFFFLVSFFWMNVMCVDMWLAFSGIRTFFSKKTAEKKRFLIYCVYAWGMPILLVLLVYLLNSYLDINSPFHPKIGDRRCFLGEGMPTFYYFYLPMAVLIGINIALFILTTVRIQRIKRETSMLKQTDSRKHNYEDDKQKFNLYLKLMFAMGINWIMELVSWAVDFAIKDTPAFVWYLTDFTNAMYGVLIFVIFVFKKKIWRSLKKRYYVFMGKPHLAHSMTTSSSRATRTSNYSTTDTAVNNDYRLSDMRNGKAQEESALNRA